MEPNDLLSNIRKHYFLGNHQKVLEIWNENQDQNFGEHLIKIEFIVSRSLMNQKILQPKSSIQFQKQPSKSLLAITDLVNKFLAPLLQPHNSSISQQKEDLGKLCLSFLDIFNKNEGSFIHQTIAYYLALAAQNSDFIIQQEGKVEKNNLELLYIQFLNYLQNYRLDLADKKLKEMKVIDDEDILTLLATTYQYIENEKFYESLQYLEEIKERFGDSTKLINIKISILIRQHNFEEAYNLSLKLFELFNTKEKVFDRIEYENCLSNLITLSEILDRQDEKFISALKTINDKCMYLKRLQQTNSLIDEFATKLSNK